MRRCHALTLLAATLVLVLVLVPRPRLFPCPSPHRHKNFTQWGELMGDNAMATATLDRLLHHAHVIVLKEDSYRLKNRMKLGLVPRQET